MKSTQTDEALVHAGAETNSFFNQTVEGLSASPRRLSCKFFYDDAGAQLFQRICDLPEYYITRSELQILRLQGKDIAATLGDRIELIGLGTGAGTKTQILLQELDHPVVYMPIDISREQLENSSARFRKIFPDLSIFPICADYLEPFDLPLPRPPSSRSVIYFPGSTIGNFEPRMAAQFLARLAELVGHDGGLLIGVDLQKDPAVIESAYNDSAGVTAAFNLNLLNRANRELGADFAVENWRHDAIYNRTEGRIEMYLVSTAQQTVHIGEHAFAFAKGERIVTEYSYKHTPDAFNALARAAGFRFQRLWTDRDKLFGLFYFTVAS
ncbi:MAG TPA: L-histidine N(alpha)-methyltransferase [Chthoniobacterales bacterium]|nr:L-histidine N(alpha)-methyltransferase [Chthoniobacterales bacterium]